MNKILKVLCISFVLFITGCKNKYITCKIDITNNVDNYSQKSVYKIYSKNNYVIKVDKKDIYISNDSKKIDYLNEINTLKLNDYEQGYTFNIEKKENSLTINSIVNLKELNLKELILDGTIDRNYVIANKLTTSGIIKYYESKGAKCDI